MSSDGGSNYNPLDEIKKAADTVKNTVTNPGSLFDPNNPLNLMNIGANLMSVGLVGYDGRGFNLQAGAQLGPADEFIGAIGGRNLAREQLYQAGQLTAREEARRAQLLADERAQQEAADRAASSAAGAAQRRTAISRGGIPLFMNDQTQGDLLGL